ncbi:TetR family transcriptional regulator [Scopulibacillus darangshiensis]|uniref:TetR family transcriptional regulator n=1 Tax=Scopulibacillus darangshiensis TaxID=442528 RepID=A0A4R2P6Y0_9BACL|nr:TetR family transcriptional regulator [Scopulibacillus darangshiensis]TCP30623.1 TetR family transcriptional regulator [Scopulibacillus darangshiensis]
MKQKQEEKYQALLQAAMDIITEKGFEKASVAEIVKKAGVAHGTYYLYFTSKNSIVPAIAEYIFEQQLEDLKEKTDDANDIWTQLKTLIDSTFNITRTYKELIIFCYSGMAFYHSFEKWEEIYFPYYRWLETKLNQAKEKKQIDPNLRTENVVRMIIGVTEQTAENMIFSNPDIDSHTIKAFKEDLFKFIKKALV